ncbi:MAG: DUF3341 domain-containing protein [Anaerolineales bacterium]|nr:DUF3341 domain-containing protein [Anaerolineales bacterium]
MEEHKTLLALFEDLDPTAAAIERLRKLGIPDDQMNVISGIPVTEAMLGRPRQWSNVPRLALGGSLGGFLVGAFLAFGAPLLYPIHVGGQALIPIPPSIVVLFELTMLGMLVSTFIGVFLDSYFPSYRPKEYLPEISDGKIGILFQCPQQKQAQIVLALKKLGAESVAPAEARQL